MYIIGATGCACVNHSGGNDAFLSFLHIDSFWDTNHNANRNGNFAIKNGEAGVEAESMDGYIDIHTHILPGVDDGAEDIEQALNLVRMAYENGTRTLFLTPHYRGMRKKMTALTCVRCLLIFASWYSASSLR